MAYLKDTYYTSLCIFTYLLIFWKLLIFRPDSFDNHYICGKSPNINDEPEISNLDVDHDFFEKEIWPQLAHRIPAFEESKVS